MYGAVTLLKNLRLLKKGFLIKFLEGIPMKWIIIVLFTILYLLITFFGLGPVFIADGAMQERVITLAVVVFLYVLLTIVFRAVLKKFK